MDTEADIADTVLDAEELHTFSGATASDAANRQEIQRTLAEGRGDSNITELSSAETQGTLYTMAKVCWSGNYSIFKRFESLVLFDLLQYQHELVELETKIIGKHGNVSFEDRAKLRNLVREYRMSKGRDVLCREFC
jgi:hypothetical protein